MEPDTRNEHRIAVIEHTKLRTWVSPSGAPYVELQVWVVTALHQQPTPLPWVRMSPASAAELAGQLLQTAAAAQGVVEPPSGPIQ